MIQNLADTDSGDDQSQSADESDDADSSSRGTEEYDEGVIRHIKRCTTEHARTNDRSWDVTDDELDAFIGLLYLRGCMNAENFPLINCGGQRSMGPRRFARQSPEIDSE